MEFLSRKQKIILIVIGVIMLLFIGYYLINKTEIYNYEELEVYEDNNINKEEVQIQEEKEEGQIIVHITGEVKNNGIIVIEKGARIADAIEKAGGITKEADLSGVNLAYQIKDGQKINIPNINEEKSQEEYITEQPGDNIIIEGKEDTDKVNINTAMQTELETLSGIGPSTALKIINYRKENGEFKQIEDIKNVPGIGEAKFENIKEEICVE